MLTIVVTVWEVDLAAGTAGGIIMQTISMLSELLFCTSGGATSYTAHVQHGHPQTQCRSVRVCAREGCVPAVSQEVMKLGH
jgi:hypothetical protein